MAHQSLMCHSHRMPLNLIFFHKLQDLLQDLFVHFHTKYTVRIRYNAVCSSGIESGDMCLLCLSRMETVLCFGSETALPFLQPAP